ncbi:hypothetical protein HOT49_gp169 [Erwinia phage vB_EamM_Alexandra]|uniref:Uncharacterized protein n=1 Tax=Erwinia phage vB_EamM_Alexandra TaxID=2201424 RepID=A0A2Z4QF62_9CAUD|nr:hypothetical protein HOT49_gp169 [Erwinia phage vB_EamM_Alexandra]AWY08441.1 hypothetical protein Alexandra_171 [Erwinia phage vB_EamM_Alexandra]
MDLLTGARECRNDFEHILRSAFRAAGFNVVDRAVFDVASARLDITVTAHVKGAATSTVDATYLEYEADIPAELMKTLGKTIRFVSCDCIEPVEPAHPAAPARWKFRGVVLERGGVPENNMQTTYLAMQGIFPDLPPLNSLTDEQKNMIKNHITMLADYLRK